MTPFVGRRPLYTPLRRSWGQRLLLTLNLLAICMALLVAAGLGYGGHKAAGVNRVALDRSLSVRPEAEPGSRVMNILLVGSDSSANLDSDDPIQAGRKGEKLGDVIIIAHIDERTRDIALLSLPRDLWITIADSEVESRINRAFVVGGPSTLIATIESNFAIPIHHYVNVDFAGFEGLVEAIGSVDVYFDAPARDWNVSAKPRPKSQTGFIVDRAGCHSLDSRQALAYVRSRYYQTQNEDGSWVSDPTADLGRIKRQQHFLRSLLRQAISSGARNPLVLGELIDVMLDTVQIDQDLTAAELVDLGGTYRSFDPRNLYSYTYPVVDGTVGLNRVLLPQHGEAAPIVELFNGAGFVSPESVSISVRHSAGGRSAQVRQVAQELRKAGFRVDFDETSQPLTPGVSLDYSPDDLVMAQMINAALGSGRGTLAEQSWMPARHIRVNVGPEIGETTTQTTAAEAIEPATTSETQSDVTSSTTQGLHDEQVGDDTVPAVADVMACE